MRGRDVENILKILKIVNGMDIPNMIKELEDIKRILKNPMYIEGDDIRMPIIPDVRIIK